jgi:crotonobetainyl-CoA:carnitine CoA-transferase CaiB-like acyl-CoA transferase
VSSAEGLPSALGDLRVVELVGEFTGLAGRYFADLGADVVVVEPPGGAALRRLPPFVDDEPHPDRSLRWWSEAAGKRSVVLDLDVVADRSRLDALLGTADVVIECETQTRLAAIDLVPDTVRDRHPALVWVSITPFTRGGPRDGEPACDLTILAGGGPMWSCGYDDHRLPPIRGQGYQSHQMGAVYAAIGALAALAARRRTGRGQRVEVNLNAVANTTTEVATYNWLSVRGVVQRQTGRHAAPVATEPLQVRTADDGYVTTGVPPRSPAQFAALAAWITELGFADELPEVVFLEQASDPDRVLGAPEGSATVDAMAVYSAARDAMNLIASRLPALEFFLGAQRRDLPVGAVLAPEEAFENEHFVARGMQVPVEHPELGRTVRYPGPPFRLTRTPWRIVRRPPTVGEHTAEVLAGLGPEPGSRAG